MYMRLTQLAIVILATILVSQPVFAQEGESKCEIDGLMDELMDKKGKSGDLLNSYMLKASLDHKNNCTREEDRRVIDIPFYKRWNVQIEKILRRHNCTWKDIPKFRRVETVWDVCSDDDGIPLVALVDLKPKVEDEKPDDMALDVASLVPKEPKKVVVVEDDLKLPPSVPILPPDPVVVKPPPEKKPEPVKTVVRITPPLKKPALTITKSPPTESHCLTWTVAGAAGGLSIVSIVVGGYFVSKIGDAEENARNAMNQIDVQRLNQEAEDHALKANAFLIAGGLLATGTATWLFFRLIDCDNTPTTVGVGIVPGGASLTVEF